MTFFLWCDSAAQRSGMFHAMFSAFTDSIFHLRRSSGTCVCKTGVYGQKCDDCHPGFFHFSSTGCRPCQCHNHTTYCHPQSGKLSRAWGLGCLLFQCERFLPLSLCQHSQLRVWVKMFNFKIEFNSFKVVWLLHIHCDGVCLSRCPVCRWCTTFLSALCLATRGHCWNSQPIWI